MPDPIDRKLEELLAYPEPGDGDEDLFVVDVMRQVEKQRRLRKVILFLFGSIGAVFGLIGASLLSGSIGELLSGSISAMTWVQLPLLAAGALAFYTWFMNDDLATRN